MPQTISALNQKFFMKQYMGHTVLSLNEVYQINKKKTKEK